MIGPVPTRATLAHGEAGERREQRVHAPVGNVVLRSDRGRRGGAAPGQHPTWTPDQVKGALMLRARYIPDAPSGSAGVGEINA